jgi:hypothetical protein
MVPNPALHTAPQVVPVLCLRRDSMRNENVPVPPSPEQPPLAPHDPPEPAPQAAAWRRAMRVVGCDPLQLRVVRHIVRRATRHRC